MTDKIILKCDATLLNNIESCERKAEYYHLQNWRPSAMPNPMDKGILGHAALKIYYKEKQKANIEKVRFNHGNAVAKALFELNRLATTTNVPIEDVQLLIKTLEGYFQYYELDTWQPIAVEQPFSVNLYEDENYLFIWEGIIDLVKDDQYGPGVSDHKFISRNRKTLDLSNQFKGYCWAMKIPTMIVNKIGSQKTLAPKDKYVRQVMSYTPKILEEWRVKTIKKLIVWCNDFKHNYFPMNETSCDKYSGCIFNEVCSKDPDMRQFHLETFFRKADKAWDVYTRDDDNE